MQGPWGMGEPGQVQPREREPVESTLVDMPEVAALAFAIGWGSIEAAGTSPITAARPQENSLHIPFDRHRSLLIFHLRKTNE